jgi:hypothetical protein
VIEQLFDRYRDVAAALERPLTLADIGARWRPNERWRELTPPVEIVGFEADDSEAQRLSAEEASPAIRYEPVALGARSGPATLYLTRDPACSSMYTPDPAAVAAHPELEIGGGPSSSSSSGQFVRGLVAEQLNGAARLAQKSHCRAPTASTVLVRSTRPI